MNWPSAEEVFRWVEGLLTRERIIVGANLLYDLEHLRAEGVRTDGCRSFHDVQLAEPLLDENCGSYSLDALARKYLGQTKASDLLYTWCSDVFGGKAAGNQRGNIYRAPPSLVGPYAEADALLPLKIMASQQGLLHDEGLLGVFEMECGLIPLLLDMRFRGVPIDVEKAKTTAAWLRAEAAKAQLELGSVDVWANASIAKAFDRVGLPYEYTAAGNPSFTKDSLAHAGHPIADLILKVRQYEKAANPFVESYILENTYAGRVHTQFHPLRTDDFGTVSGRFSSSNPNLQNIPARDKEIGPLLRGLFIPEEGCSWRKMDYSQIEYRLLAHYGVGPGAEEIRERYRTDPKTDFHELTIALVKTHTGIDLDRKPAKGINFGMVYGMGKDKLIRSLGLGQDAGARLYDAYFQATPSVRETYDGAARLAKRRGYIKTVLGRRRRFVEGSGTHKALNALLQGGAADIMKMGMLMCYRAGVFKATGTPHLTVHDELDWSDDGSAQAAEGFLEAKNIMETCVPNLRVPLRVDVSSGPHWGACG
jgi:DNA polymerase I-like protein with 3'-5' exonuclease and polymerase domains